MCPFQKDKRTILKRYNYLYVILKGTKMHKVKAENGNANIVGKKIKEYRLSHDMSLRDMVLFLQNHDLDWDKNALNRAEQGKRTIIDIEVKKLAVIFNVSSDELLDLE